MSDGHVRGTLRDPGEAPSTGELDDRLLTFANAVVIQTLSGSLEAPVDYVQDQAEWVVVLTGGATLEVEGETVELAARDWLYLPAGLPHRVLRVEPGTDWLAFHLFPDAASAAG